MSASNQIPRYDKRLTPRNFALDLAVNTSGTGTAALLSASDPISRVPYGGPKG